MDHSKMGHSMPGMDDEMCSMDVSIPKSTQSTQSSKLVLTKNIIDVIHMELEKHLCDIQMVAYSFFNLFHFFINCLGDVRYWLRISKI